MGVFGGILARPKTETYMMTVIIRDTMMNPRQKVRTLKNRTLKKRALRKLMKKEVPLSLVLLLEMKQDVLYSFLGRVVQAHILLELFE